MAAPARRAALEALCRVEEEGAYAPFAVAAADRRMALSERDRRLATELVYGVLRWRGRLDHLLSRFVRREFSSLPARVRNALRLALFQLIFLDSVPEHVACHEAVELVKERHPWASGFVNAVCRNAIRSLPELQEAPPEAATETASFAAWHSHPEWLVRRWIERMGRDEAARLCSANNDIPPTTLRVNRAKASVGEARDALAAAGARAEAGLVSPDALRLRGGGAVDALPGFVEGRFSVQDESSQLVAYVVDPPPQGRIADLCAAPGGKSTHLAERILAGRIARGGTPPEGPAVWAFDVRPARERLIRENARRLGVDALIRTQVADARALTPGEVGRFARVLLDAPCSGTGVIRRRPDLKWHKETSDLRALVELQRSLLAAAASLVEPGGALVYTTCSIEPEENVENARWFLDAHPEFAASNVRDFLPDEARRRLGEERFGTGGASLQLLPHLDGTDGFFYFRAVRVR